MCKMNYDFGVEFEAFTQTTRSESKLNVSCVAFMQSSRLESSLTHILVR